MFLFLESVGKIKFLKLIRLFDVYLNQQLPVKVKPTERLIKTAIEFIGNSIKEMKDLLTEVDENIAEIDNFPRISEEQDTYPCSYCNFQKICYE